MVALLDELSLGALLCVSTLILGLVSRSTKGYEEVVDKAIRSLNMLSFQKDRFPEYRYYHTLCPWLQVKLLRILQVSASLYMVASYISLLSARQLAGYLLMLL